jgi:hypothetical protein
MQPVIAAAKADRERAAIDRGLSEVDARVAVLEALFWQLEADLETGLYATAIKLSASGKAVEVRVFKAQQVVQFRGLLDDIARERGGRKVRAEVSGPEDAPFVFTLSFDRLADRAEQYHELSHMSLHGYCQSARQTPILRPATRLRCDEMQRHLSSEERICPQ